MTWNQDPILVKVGHQNIWSNQLIFLHKAIFDNFVPLILIHFLAWFCIWNRQQNKILRS